MKKRPKLQLTRLDLSSSTHLVVHDGGGASTSLQRHSSLELPLSQSLLSQCSSSNLSGRPPHHQRLSRLPLSEKLTLSRTEKHSLSQNFDTSQCSDDYMTPSNQPIISKTHQQLQEEAAFQRISTFSRVDPCRKTIFDSFSTIVQELPAADMPGENPFMNGDQHRLNELSGKGQQQHGHHGATRLMKEFKSIQLIGHGSFGEVYCAKLIADGTFYAIKRLKHVLPRVSGSIALTALLKEAHCLSYLASQAPECIHILRYYSSWIDPSDQSIYIQTEYCGRGNLAKRYVDNEQIDEEMVVEIARQVCLGLHAMHSRGIVHLDIKPENLLETDRGTVKISDFGLCAKMDRFRGDHISISEGDARYLSDELLNDNYSHLDYVDMFALGATLLELCRGVPLPAQGLEYRQIRLGQFSLPDRFSPSLQQLIRSLLAMEPTARPSALDVLTTLSDGSCPLPSSVRDISHQLESAMKRIAILEKELHIAYDRSRS